MAVAGVAVDGKGLGEQVDGLPIVPQSRWRTPDPTSGCTRPSGGQCRTRSRIRRRPDTASRPGRSPVPAPAPARALRASSSGHNGMGCAQPPRQLGCDLRPGRRQPRRQTEPDARQTLVTDPHDDTRIINHGTLVVPRFGFVRTEDPCFEEGGPGARRPGGQPGGQLEPRRRAVLPGPQAEPAGPLAEPAGADPAADSAVQRGPCPSGRAGQAHAEQVDWRVGTSTGSAADTHSCRIGGVAGPDTYAPSCMCSRSRQS